MIFRYFSLYFVLYSLINAKGELLGDLMRRSPDTSVLIMSYDDHSFVTTAPNLFKRQIAGSSGCTLIEEDKIVRDPVAEGVMEDVGKAEFVRARPGIGKVVTAGVGVGLLIWSGVEAAEVVNKACDGKTSPEAVQLCHSIVAQTGFDLAANLGCFALSQMAVDGAMVAVAPEISPVIASPFGQAVTSVAAIPLAQVCTAFANIVVESGKKAVSELSPYLEDVTKSLKCGSYMSAMIGIQRLQLAGAIASGHFMKNVWLSSIDAIRSEWSLLKAEATSTESSVSLIMHPLLEAQLEGRAISLEIRCEKAFFGSLWGRILSLGGSTQITRAVLNTFGVTNGIVGAEVPIIAGQMEYVLTAPTCGNVNAVSYKLHVTDAEDKLKTCFSKTVNAIDTLFSTGNLAVFPAVKDKMNLASCDDIPSLCVYSEASYKGERVCVHDVEGTVKLEFKPASIQFGAKLVAKLYMRYASASDPTGGFFTHSYIPFLNQHILVDSNENIAELSYVGWDFQTGEETVLTLADGVTVTAPPSKMTFYIKYGMEPITPLAKLKTSNDLYVDIPFPSKDGAVLLPTSTGATLKDEAGKSVDFVSVSVLKGMSLNLNVGETPVAFAANTNDSSRSTENANSTSSMVEFPLDVEAHKGLVQHNQKIVLGPLNPQALQSAQKDSCSENIPLPQAIENTTTTASASAACIPGVKNDDPACATIATYQMCFSGASGHKCDEVSDGGKGYFIDQEFPGGGSITIGENLSGYLFTVPKDALPVSALKHDMDILSAFAHRKLEPGVPFTHIPDPKADSDVILHVHAKPAGKEHTMTSLSDAACVFSMPDGAGEACCFTSSSVNAPMCQNFIPISLSFFGPLCTQSVGLPRGEGCMASININKGTIFTVGSGNLPETTVPYVDASASITVMLASAHLQPYLDGQTKSITVPIVQADKYQANETASVWINEPSHKTQNDAVSSCAGANKQFFYYQQDDTGISIACAGVQVALECKVPVPDAFAAPNDESGYICTGYRYFVRDGESFKCSQTCSNLLDSAPADGKLELIFKSSSISLKDVDVLCRNSASYFASITNKETAVPVDEIYCSNDIANSTKPAKAESSNSSSFDMEGAYDVYTPAYSGNTTAGSWNLLDNSEYICPKGAYVTQIFGKPTTPTASLNIKCSDGTELEVISAGNDYNAYADVSLYDSSSGIPRLIVNTGEVVNSVCTIEGKCIASTSITHSRVLEGDASNCVLTGFRTWIVNHNVKNIAASFACKAPSFPEDAPKFDMSHVEEVNTMVFGVDNFMEEWDAVFADNRRCPNSTYITQIGGRVEESIYSFFAFCSDGSKLEVTSKTIGSGMKKPVHLPASSAGYSKIAVKISDSLNAICIEENCMGTADSEKIDLQGNSAECALVGFKVSSTIFGRTDKLGATFACKPSAVQNVAKFDLSDTRLVRTLMYGADKEPEDWAADVSEEHACPPDSYVTSFVGIQGDRVSSFTIVCSDGSNVEVVRKQETGIKQMEMMSEPHQGGYPSITVRVGAAVDKLCIGLDCVGGDGGSEVTLSGDSEKCVLVGFMVRLQVNGDPEQIGASFRCQGSRPVKNVVLETGRYPSNNAVF